MEKKWSNRATYTILMLVCVVGFWVFENFYTPTTNSDPKKDSVDTTLPKDFLPSSTTGVIVEHNYFTLSYSEVYEQAEWVAYFLSRNQLTQDERKRPFFMDDPSVRTKSADWRNYKGSGYDRGHLCPAGDRRFSEQAYNETFYTSNISPQNAEFNAGIWNRLELQIRIWAKKYGTVFIVAGGVLEKGLDTIGDEDVAVPKYFYKIVAKKEEDHLCLIAFLVPSVESEKALQDLTVTVDSIEKLTGINFFEKLEHGEEARLEGIIDISHWTF